MNVRPEFGEEREVLQTVEVFQGGEHPGEKEASDAAATSSDAAGGTSASSRASDFARASALAFARSAISSLHS